MNESERTEFTQILRDLVSNRHSSHVEFDRAFEIVYGELRKLAGVLMHHELSDHTLQPTALVHEAYFRLVDQKCVEWQDRAHFFGIASRAMRQILVEHARKRSAARRGGGLQKVPLDENIRSANVSDIEIVDLSEALDRLADLDERMARVVEMRVFGGLTSEEIALVLGVSRGTVQNDWRFARMWFGRELSEESSS